MLGNNLAFATLYWLIRQRRADRAAPDPTPVDFAFTQHMGPELAPPGLETCLPGLPAPQVHQRDGVQPHRRDATTHRAKYTMLVQSAVALALFGLIVARAVNAFT